MSNRLRYENGGLDETDVKLLQALHQDARRPVAELARLVGLSAPSVSERLRRLEEAGVITGYSVQVDPAAIGQPLTAWLRIRPVPGQMHHVADILGRLEEVVECDRITGEDCFIARAHVSDMGALEKLIDELIPYSMTNTSIAQSSPVPQRLPPLHPSRTRR